MVREFGQKLLSNMFAKGGKKPTLISQEYTQTQRYSVGGREGGEQETSERLSPTLPHLDAVDEIGK